MTSATPMRRVAGYHAIRMDGISDLVLRARGAAVLDVGCNRGLVGFEFACNGARLVHGVDSYEDGIKTARELFADLRDVRSQFEIADLSTGSSSLASLGVGQYDVVLMLAVLHKLTRVMDAEALESMIRYLGSRSSRYVGWRATVQDGHENKAERTMLDRVLGEVGFRRAQYSEISDLGPAGVWERR